MLEPKPYQLQSRYPNPGDGAQWQQGKQLRLKRSFHPYGERTTFQCYFWAPGADLTPPTHAPCEGRQLASLGRVCLLKPTCSWVDEPSKCHSSSAAIPLAQPSKEQHSVISALGDVQGSCPEPEAPHSHPLRRDT